MKKLGIIGAPIKHGQSVNGVDFGPDAFRANRLIETIKEASYEVKDFGNISFDKTKLNNNNNLKNLYIIKDANINLKNKVSNTLEEDCFPLIIGGDHSLAIGSISAISNKFDNLGVIWFDAHTDINTEYTTPSGNIHGMSLACLLGYGNDELTSIVDTKIKPENVVIIGARSIDDGEVDIINKLNIKVFDIDHIKEVGISKVMDEAISYLKSKTNTVHLSFDLDSLDPFYCPAVGIRVEDGINLNDTLLAFNKLKAANFLVGMDVVEYNPLLDKDNLTLNNALKMISEIL